MDCYVEKIYTNKGITKDNIFKDSEKVLHIGSGSAVLQGAESIDILDLPGVDVVHDLDVFPWPYKDNEFDLVFGHNVFEHLTDQVKTMEEIWRILKPGGRVVITVPYFRSTDAFTDTTHKHFFTSGSMNYFLDLKNNSQSEYRYTEKRFEKVGFWYGWPQKSGSVLVRMFKNFIHNHPKIYDSHIALLLPVKIVIWELKAIKSK